MVSFDIALLTGNTRGDTDRIAKELSISWRLAQNSADKKACVTELGADTCASIGNGFIDCQMMEAVALSIVTLQAEGRECIQKPC